MKTLILSLGLLLMLLGCEDNVSEPPTLASLRGDVVYLPRIALPEDASVQVQLQDVSLQDVAAKVISEQTLHAPGQVPIAFELKYDPASLLPRHSYSLQARISDAGGKLLWINTQRIAVDPMALKKRYEIRVEQIPTARPSKPTTVLVMECDGLNFVAEIRPNGAWLFLPGHSALLPQQEAASGTKYQDDKALFWTKGDSATLEYNGKKYSDCKNNRRAAIWEAAKLKGVDFRGLGNEPGWVIEISGNHIDVLADYGSTQIAFDDVTVNTLEQSTVYQGQQNEHQLTVTLAPGPCMDTMADEEFEVSVTLELDGRQLRGCGKALH